MNIYKQNEHALTDLAFSSCKFSDTCKGVKMQIMASFSPNNHKSAHKILLYGPILTIQSSRESLIDEAVNQWLIPEHEISISW